jgi:hypothetical protein
MQTPEPTSKTLNAVRSPLVFNALVTLLLTSIVVAVLATSLPDWFRMSVVGFYFAWITAMALWIYKAYRKDPRGLAYGPNEYIEESKLAHERQMEAMRLSAQQSK